MAEQGRTVRVSGLPTDIEDDRLTDKLYIHFLRARHGGGEIASVTIVKTTPGSALITFEDCGVAQRVIQHGRHTLRVDGKKYELTLTEHRKSLEPDKVILSMSVTVDYSQLPLGRAAVTSLHKSHPDVQINYNTPEELCTLRGAYSHVQAALAQLLGRPGGPGSAEHKDTSHPASSGSRAAHTVQRPHTQGSVDQGRRANGQREHTEQGHTARPSGDCSSSPHGDLTPEGHGWEDTGQTKGGAVALQLPGDPTTAEEDFSLIMDADMFQYLQKHVGEEYQHILRQYGVEVVDVTAQGVTTLFLQSAAGVGEVGREQERLRSASGEISRLYQENEAKIRRAQLSKSILTPRGGLPRAMENLGVRLPKLLLSEDDRNVYIIGSSSDVSEAKQFLLLGRGRVSGNGEDVASLLRSPSFDSDLSNPAEEERVALARSSTAGTDKMLSLDEEERRADAARRYKLAARFKDSGLGGLGTRSGDFALPGVSSPSRRTGLGPMLGHDVLSETAGFAGGRLSRAVAQNTGDDILFKTSVSSELVGTRHKFTTASLSTTQTDLSGSTAFPPAGSGSSLKRSSSFSGTSRPKAQVLGQKVQEDSGTSTSRVRGRSSSFRTGREKREVYSAEIKLSIVMWQYIKQAFRTRLEDLTSDLQMKESHLEASRDLTVILTGLDLSTVTSCQLGLQKLVDMVAADFCVQELRLSVLGVADPADETLEVCCAEVRSRFKKVSIQTLKESLFLLGPKQLCSQVGAALREVFSGAPVQIPGQQDFSGPSTSTWNQSIPLRGNEDQNTTLHHNSNPPQELEDRTGGDDGTGSGQERKSIQRGDSSETQRNGEAELVNGSASQPLVRKDPVMKEKVRRPGTVQVDGQKTDASISHSAKGSDRSVRRVNGIGSAAVYTDQDMATLQKESKIHSRVTQRDDRQQDPEIQDNPGGSRSIQRGLGGICVCGESGASVKRMECGVTLCSKCLAKVHVHCRVCPKTELMPQGIQGNMSYSELPISLLGHSKDSTVKITYCIPDGIQGEGHPSPGLPFRGGVFDAFLPLCEKTKKLLPRLEKAFRLGLTFTVTGKDAGARVTWDCIPHKTSLQGGRSGNGYPDSGYLTRLSAVLASHGIEETPAKSQD
ncbi:uncharacterized protein LOC139919513 [Centroberyx gerrardi]